MVLDRVGPHRPVLYAPGQSDAALEYVPGAVYTVSAFRLEAADATVVAALDLAVGAQVAFVERRAQVEGQPIMLLRTWLTSRLAAMLEARDFEDRLFVQVFQRANLTIARSREAPLACVADAHQAAQLGVEAGVPLVRVRRIGYSLADVPISLTYCDFSPSATRAKSTSACFKTTESALRQTGAETAPHTPRWGLVRLGYSS
ncbi:GntR family transcriptional regulator [Ralstonia sp. 1B3]